MLGWAALTLLTLAYVAYAFNCQSWFKTLNILATLTFITHLTILKDYPTIIANIIILTLLLISVWKKK